MRFFGGGVGFEDGGERGCCFGDTETLEFRRGGSSGCGCGGGVVVVIVVIEECSRRDRRQRYRRSAGYTRSGRRYTSAATTGG